MLILLTILLLSAAVSAYFYLYRRKNSDQLLNEPDLSHLRPLFMPSDADLLAEELESQQRLKAIAAAEAEAEENRRNVEFRDRLDRWKAAPTRSATLDLLNSVQNDGTFLADAAESICEEWNNGRLDLSATDLAQLIESQSWLVPAEKRTPGVSYRIQRLLSSLRAGGGNTLQTHDSLR